MSRHRILAAAVTAALAACGGGGSPGSAPAACTPASVAGPATFAQSDLAGSWDRIVFRTNGAPWVMEGVTVDAAGAVTFGSCRTPAGVTTCGAAPGAVVWNLDAAGGLSASGTGGNPTLRGFMTRGKDLAFGTFTNASAGAATNHGLFALRRRVPGVAFSAADAAHWSFAYHKLTAGPQPGWERGAGSTDGAGRLSVAAVSTPAGPQQPPAAAFDTVELDADGLASLPASQYFGFMAADKKSLFLLGNDPVPAGQAPVFTFVAVLATGQCFGQADMTGAWGFARLNSGPTVAASSWVRGRLTVDGAGAVSYDSVETPAGPTTAAGFTLLLDAGGATTRSDSPSYAGQVAWSKEFLVRTETAGGQSNLGFLAR
jgi:hypothetical protein